MLILSSDGKDLVDAQHLTIVAVEGGFRIVDRGHFAEDQSPLYLSKLYQSLEEAGKSLQYVVCSHHMFFFNEANSGS